MIDALDNVGIAVTDLDDALEFYETLGLETDRYSESDARVDPAGTEDDPYLYVFETGGDEAASRNGDLFTNPAGIDHVSIRVTDVDETVAELEAEGVEFFQAPTTEADWGLRLAGTHDPSGNVFYFVTYV